jgi:predicted transposase YdaD
MYDNTCKYLAENFTEDIASWLIGSRVTLTELNPTELNVDPIRADSIILLLRSIFLESQGLYPFAILAQTDEPESILRTVAARIEEIGAGRVQADLAATASILAGLVLNRDLVKQILRRDIMRESVIYQDILEEGEIKGKTEGLAEGRVEEAKGLVIRLLTRKLGNISPDLLAKIEALQLDRVELLAEDLLDFSSIDDLNRWLA